MFLEKFMEHEKLKKWIHIDIAGTADIKSAKGVYSAGATGFGT